MHAVQPLGRCHICCAKQSVKQASHITDIILCLEDTHVRHRVKFLVTFFFIIFIFGGVAVVQEIVHKTLYMTK